MELRGNAADRRSRSTLAAPFRDFRLLYPWDMRTEYLFSPEKFVTPPVTARGQFIIQYFSGQHSASKVIRITTAATRMLIVQIMGSMLPNLYRDPS